MTQNTLARLKRSLVEHPDRISGGLLIVLSLFAIAEASHLPFGSARAPDAGFFPLSLSTLLLIFAGGIFVKSFFASSEPARFGSESWYVVIAAAAFILYAVVMTKVGFVIATTLIMLLIMRGLGGMSWVRAVTIAVASVVLTYLAFVQLGVPLPRGPLPF
jgi:hypothetical protein